MNHDNEKNTGVTEETSDKFLSAGETPSFTDQVREVGIYWQLARARDESDFKRRILAVLERIGFSDFSYGTISAQLSASSKVICTMEDLRKIYVAERYYLHDIVLQHGKKSPRPILTSTVNHYIASYPFQTRQLQRNLEWVELCKSHGYYDAYNIPFAIDEDDSKVMLSVFSKSLEQTQFRTLIARTRTVLHLLVEAVSYLGSQKFPESMSAGDSNKVKNPEALPKSLKLLNILAKEDLPLKDAATALSISIDTANKHLAAVKRALGANTQAAAVYLAVKEGLIECD